MTYFALLWLAVLLSLPLLRSVFYPPWNALLLFGATLFLVLSPALGLAYVIVYAWRSKKDYYAFLSLTGYLGLMSLIVMQLMQPQLLTVFLDVLQIKLPSNQTVPPLAVILLLGVIAIAATAGFALFVRHYYSSRPANESVDGAQKLHPFIAALMTAVLPKQAPETPIVFTPDPPKPPHIEPFFQRALDAVRRKYPRYSWIKLNQKDWHPHIECWVGEDTTTNSVAILLCNANPNPRDEERTRLEQIRKTVGVRPYDLIQCAKSASHLFRDTSAFNDQIIYSEFLSSAVNFAEYKHYIWAEACEKKLDNSERTLSDIYVERRVKDRDGVEHQF